MAQPCKICNHPKRKDIETSAKSNEKSLLSIAKQYAVSYPALHRHLQNHMGPDSTTQAALGASQMDTSAIAELKAEAIPELPEGYKPRPGQIDAYRDMLYLRDKAVALIESLESDSGDEENPKKPSVYEMSVAMKELRETTKAMVSVYEAQKRIEAEYTPPDTLSASYVYQWLKGKYPAVLLELVADMKAVR